MRNKCAFFVGGILLLVVSLAFGQNQEVVLSGQVIDAETSSPLTWATLYFTGKNKSVTTDENGYFQCEEKFSLPVELEINHLGYETHTVHVTDPSTIPVTIKLKAEPIFIEDILVVGSPNRKQVQSAIVHDPSEAYTAANDVGSLFEHAPGFSVVKRGSYAVDPVFRSFRNEQLNVQYDGGIRVMHACPNRMDPITTHVIPEEVQKIELIKGPFSVRYGQTMGAVLNIVTSQPAHADQFMLSGSIETSYETNGSGNTNRLNLQGAGNSYDFLVTGGYRHASDYLSGGSMEVPASYKTTDYSAKVGFEPAKNQRIQLGYRESRGRDIDHAALPMDTEYDDSRILSADYEVRGISKVLNSISLKSYFSDVQHLMHNSLRPNFMMVEAETAVEAQTIGSKLEMQLFPNSNAVLYAGLDFQFLTREGVRDRLVKRDRMTGEILENPMQFTDEVWQDAVMMQSGVYLEGNFFTQGNWTFAGGMRLDRVTADIEQPASDFAALYPGREQAEDYMVSGHGSVRYEFNKKNSLELALGRGVRTPTMEERFINHFTIGSDAFEYVGNPNLNAEANHQIELGYTGTTKDMQIKGSIFHSIITDYITARVDSSIQRKYMPSLPPVFAKRFENIDVATQWGGELEISIPLNEWFTVEGFMSYTYAENKDWEEPLAEIPPFKAALSIQFEKDWLNAECTGRFSARQNRVSDSFQETSTPSYFLLDLRGGATVWDDLKLGASVTNLFDINYYDHLNRGYRNSELSGRLFEPGRSFSLFARYSF